jgi:hypothetical protein
MHLTAVMVSCPERADTRRQTLANLAATDWNAGVALAIDDGDGPDRIARIDATCRRALALGAESDADVILLLEDDLDFNRHLRANILRWSRLVGVDALTPFFASLYNPGYRVQHTRPEGCFRVLAPRCCWGAQALLVSRALARHFLGHWSDEEGPPDLRMPRLAGRFVPIYCHQPSLVQHIGRVSTWGGFTHEAIDFDRDWSATVMQSP